MVVRISERGKVPSFRAMEILKDLDIMQAQGRTTFKLCLGQPSTPAPRPVLDAAAQALRNNALGYTAADGTPELREQIARHYRNIYGADVTPDRIVVTTGSSAAFTGIFLTAFDAGDVVVMTRPGYPAYRNMLHAMGCTVRLMDCGPATRWQPTPELLDQLVERAGGAAPAGLIIASPANPMGTILGAEQMKAVCEWCDEHGTLLISDEAYHGITYAQRAVSAVEFSQTNIAVGSFSKYFSMTGWRLGWAVLPSDLVAPMEGMMGNLSLAAPTLSQLGAVAAFTPDAIEEANANVRRYDKNRAIVLEGLRDLGVTHVAPADGAFYAYADISQFTNDSMSWCAELLAQTGVAVTPGVDFAQNAADCDDPSLSPELDGSRFIRISFAGDASDIREGMRRLVEFARARRFACSK